MNLKNITPIMTDEYEPIPYRVTQRTYNGSGSNKGWKAFNPNPKIFWDVGNNAVTWIDLNFASNRIADAFSITLYRPDVNDIAPKTIIIYGTNDNGATLEEIKTFTDLKFRDYPITRKIPHSNYKKYRLSITEPTSIKDSPYGSYYYIQNIYYYEDLDYTGTSEKIRTAIIDTIKNNQKIIDCSMNFEIDGGE